MANRLAIGSKLGSDANRQVFEIFASHFSSSVMPLGGKPWLPHSVADVSRALSTLEYFVSEDLPLQVQESFDEVLMPNPQAQGWIIHFAAKMEQRFPFRHSKHSCLSFFEEDCSWTVTHIWLEWRHFLTPPTWAFASRSSYVAWQRVLGKQLALSDEEKDVLRFCANILASHRFS